MGDKKHGRHGRKPCGGVNQTTRTTNNINTRRKKHEAFLDECKAKKEES